MVRLGHREIDDGKHHGDVCLQRNNQDVEDRPNTAGNKLDEPRQEGNQDEDEFTGKEVAEKPQRERDHFGEVFDDF